MIKVNALLPADNIYQDYSTDKFILAGIYHSIQVPELPFVYRNSLNVYCSLMHNEPDTSLILAIVHPETEHIVTETEAFNLPENESGSPLEFIVEFADFEIRDQGMHIIQVYAEDEVIFEAPLFVNNEEEA